MLLRISYTLHPIHVYDIFRFLNLLSKLSIQGVCQLFVQWDTNRRLNSFNLWTSQKVWPNEVRRRRKGWCWLFCAAFLAFKVKDSSSKTLVTAILEKLMSLGTSLSTYTAIRWKLRFGGIRIHLSKQTAISQEEKETYTRQER